MQPVKMKRIKNQRENAVQMKIKKKHVSISAFLSAGVRHAQHPRTLSGIRHNCRNVSLCERYVARQVD